MSHSLNEIVLNTTGTADECFEAIVDFLDANTPLTKDENGLWIDANKTCGIATSHTSGSTTAKFKGRANASVATTERSITVTNATVRIHVSTNETAFYIKIGSYTWTFAQNINDVWTIFASSINSNSDPEITMQNSESLYSTSSFRNIVESASYCSLYKFIDLYNQVLYKELYRPITIQSGLLANNGIVSFNGTYYRFIRQAAAYWHAIAFPVSDE